MKGVILVGAVLVLAFGSVFCAFPATSGVSLQYIGHASFLLTSPGGTTILMDPYLDRPAGLGPMPTNLAPSAVTVSHDHADHNNVACVPEGTMILRDGGRTTIGDVVVTGYAGNEGSPNGPSDVLHTVFVFEVAGVKIVHLGDSGPVTDPTARAAISSAQVVIVSVDGYVIPQDDIWPFLSAIQAKTVLPVHYSVRASAPFHRAPTIDQFLAALPTDVVRVKSADSTLVVVRKMPTQVLVLTPSALVK